MRNSKLFFSPPSPLLRVLISHPRLTNPSTRTPFTSPSATTALSPCPRFASNFPPPTPPQCQPEFSRHLLPLTTRTAALLLSSSLPMTHCYRQAPALLAPPHSLLTLASAARQLLGLLLPLQFVAAAAPDTMHAFRRRHHVCFARLSLWAAAAVPQARHRALARAVRAAVDSGGGCCCKGRA